MSSISHSQFDVSLTHFEISLITFFMKKINIGFCPFRKKVQDHKILLNCPEEYAFLDFQKKTDWLIFEFIKFPVPT
jgi:hypothetical protein